MAKIFRVKVISPEARAKIARAVETSRVLSQRDLNCPYCGYRINTVFGDTGGHIQSK